MTTPKIGIYALEHGWLKTYRDTPCGRGAATFTLEKSEAMMFPTVYSALTFYRQQSTTVPLRPDGRANRPLTALTVEISPIEV